MNKFMKTQKKIERGVVSGYKKIENGVVSSYKRIENKFVETFLTPDNGISEEESKADIKSQPHDKEN